MPRSSTFRLLFAASLLAAAPRVHADCIDDAAARHQVNALVLRAIGWHESRLQPRAVGRNANGTSDIGAFQINDVHLPALARLGVSAKALMDGCVSADAAAWHYRRQVDAFGNTWVAVGAYHSRTPALLARYANAIAATLTQWRVMPVAKPPFDVSSPLRELVAPPNKPLAAADARPGSNTRPALRRAPGTPSRPPPPPRSGPQSPRQATSGSAEDPADFSNLAFRPSAR